ncbi:MAG TPA: hypothetical protein VIK20_04555 [Bacteroidales bacterium]
MKEKKNELNGYPVYPPEEDIYIQALKESSISPEAISKTIVSKKEEQVEIDTVKDLSDIDLDVPGSELDDEQEIIGNEDEENNYYSLGGDAHENP